MGVRETWSELGTGVQLLLGLFVGGVVLVVGIVVLVVLAAVVGSFALGMGESTGTASPEVDFTGEYDASSETFEITHQGGESVQAATLTVEAGDRTSQWADEDSSVTAGDSMVVDATSGTTVRVVWDDGTESMVLYRTTAE